MGGAFPHWPVCGGQVDRDLGWHRPHDCVCARVQGHGRLQLRRCACGPQRSCIFDVHGEEADAKAAYAALVDFAGVVKANPITASTPAASVSGGSIGAAAGKLSAAAYPFIKDVDRTSDLF